MQKAYYTVEERFTTNSEQERKRIIQQKMECYLRHVLCSGDSAYESVIQQTKE